MPSKRVYTAVSSRSLSCMLSRNKEYDIVLAPEPFRLQSNVVFHVAYSEYINYVRSLSVDSQHILSAPVAVLQRLSDMNSDQLYLYYLQDMAFALAKEVWFAESNRCDGSIILPSSEGAELKASTLLGIRRYFNGHKEAFHKLVEHHGYSVARVRSSHNVNLLAVAECLYYLSGQESSGARINLEYDF